MTVIVSSLYLYFYNLYFFKFVYMYSSVKSIFISFEHDLYMAFVGPWLKLEMLVSRLIKFNLRNLLTKFILLIVSPSDETIKLHSKTDLSRLFALVVWFLWHFVLVFLQICEGNSINKSNYCLPSWQCIIIVQIYCPNSSVDHLLRNTILNSKNI